MPKEINLPKEIVEAGSQFRGIDPSGKSVNFSDNAVKSFTSSARSFAVYDAASDTVPFNLTFVNVASFSEDIRFEFSGPRTEEDYFPFDPALKNDLIAPAPTKFDFREIPKGVFMQFDVEFRTRLYGTGSGLQIDKHYFMYVEFEYPNGGIETRSFELPYTTEFTRPAQLQYNKLSFSTYIKDELTDQLLGGKIRIYGIDPLSSLETLNVAELIVRVYL